MTNHVVLHKQFTEPISNDRKEEPKMKRLVLTYNEKRTDREEEAEFDTAETIRILSARLREQGLVVASTIDVSTCSIPRLVGRLERLRPDLVFNIAEGHRGPFREAFYPALFEQLGLRHIGSPASVIALCLDKALTKRVVREAAVPVPRGVLLRDAREIDAALPSLVSSAGAGPWIVKPNYEGSSKGITPASIVRAGARETETSEMLAFTARELLDRYPDGVLIEELIAGQDVSVGFIDGLGLLPPIGYAYDGPGSHGILDLALKQTSDQERVRVDVPARLDPRVSSRLIELSERVFGALDVRGFGRADYRITPDGEIFFLEMNALPSLSEDDLYLAAARLGASRCEMLGCIVDAASAPVSATRTPEALAPPRSLARETIPPPP